MEKIKAILRQNPCNQRLQCAVQGFELRGVYLNDDEQPEFLVQRPADCGTGGCQEVLLGLIDGKWTPLAQVELGGIKVTKAKSNSMRDIALFDHKEATDTGFYYRFRHFSWDGSQYKLVSVARELSRPE